MKSLLWVLITVLIATAARVEAQGNSDTQSGYGGNSTSKVYKYVNRKGNTSFSDRAPVNRRYQIINLGMMCYACNLNSMVDWYKTPLHLNLFQEAINKSANHYGVDPALIRAVIHAESAFQPGAKSKAGALGLMQLMPGTAKAMGVEDPMSPDENIRGGVRYLHHLMQTVGGNIALVTAAYNAGPNAVARHRGIPPFEETETYVKRVKILYARYRETLARS